MERLKKYIEHFYDKKKIPTELSSDEIEELEFLNDFVKTIDLKNIYTILNCNKRNFVISAIISNKNHEPISLLKDKINRLDNSFFTCTDYNEIYELYNSIIIFIEKNEFQLIENISPFVENNDQDFNKEIEEKNLLNDVNKLKEQLKKYTKNEEQRKNLIDLFLNYSYELTFSLVATSVINEAATSSNSNLLSQKNISSPIQNNKLNYLSINNNDSNIDLTDKNCLRRVNDLIMNAAHFKDLFISMQNRIKEIENLPITREKENSKITKKKERILAYLDSFDLNKPIDLSNSFLELIDNQKLKYFIIGKIIRLNLEHQKNTIIELDKEKELSKIELLFKNSKFSFEKLLKEQVENLIKYGNIDSIEKILTILTDSDIKFNDNFPIYDILLLSNQSNVANIIKLYNVNLINEEFIIKNPNIFVDTISEDLKKITSINEPKYNELNNNITQLKEIKININEISKKDSKILLMNNKELETAITLIKNYHLDYSTSNNFELISNIKNIEIADKFIELGLGDYLITHPYLIAKRANNRLKRMQLCKMLEIPLMQDGKINSKITSQEFRIGKNYINDDDIESFISNSTPRYQNLDCLKILVENYDYNYELEEIKELEKYKTNDLEYNINGIIISRNKVLRNYSILSKNITISNDVLLFNSIIYGSVLDDEQLDMLSNLIINKQKEKLINR